MVHFDLEWLKQIKVKDVPVRRKGRVMVLSSTDTVVKALSVRASFATLAAVAPTHTVAPRVPRHSVGARVG